MEPAISANEIPTAKPMIASKNKKTLDGKRVAIKVYKTFLKHITQKEAPEQLS
jgi:hypothetical protein